MLSFSISYLVYDTLSICLCIIANLKNLTDILIKFNGYKLID